MSFKHNLICFIYFIGVNQLIKSVICDVKNSREISIYDKDSDTSCQSGDVFNGSICINVTDCTKPVLSNRRCLQRCPDGYIYFTMNAKYNYDILNPRKYHYTAADINENPCLNKTMIGLLILFSVIANIVYILFVWWFLSTKRFPSEKLKARFVRFCKRRRRGGERERLINANSDDDDDAVDDGFLLP